MWLHILLSALAFNGAFFFPDYLGFLILVSPIPIVVLLSNISNSWTGFKAGWWWGVLVFGMHFTWLFELLARHTQSSWLLCGTIYLVVVAYFALSSACWLWMTQTLASTLQNFIRILCLARWGGLLALVLSLSKDTCARMVRQAHHERKQSSVDSVCWLKPLCVSNHILIFMLTTIAYWLCIENWIFVPPRLGTGYPFLNPCIPLSTYPTFLKCISLLGTLWWGGSVDRLDYAPVNIVYVAPVINRIKNTTAVWRSHPEAVGHKLHYQLCKNVYHNEPACAQAFYVAPETTFPFSLNHYPQIIDLWSSAISEESHFFVGGTLQEGKRLYQAIFWLQRSPIINIYVKKKLTPFVEKIPTAWKNIPMLKNIFLAGVPEFCDDAECCDTEFFDVTPTLRIIPRICLEFFFEGRMDFDLYKDPSKRVKIFFFANDSWFNKFFRTILSRLVVIKAHLIGLPVVYVGHFGCNLSVLTY